MVLQRESEKDLGCDSTISIKNRHILVVLWCHVWRPKSTKSNGPYDRWLLLYLGPSMVNKLRPSGAVSSFCLTCLCLGQNDMLKQGESPVLAMSRSCNFQTCSDVFREFIGGHFTLV